MKAWKCIGPGLIYAVFAPVDSLPATTVGFLKRELIIDPSESLTGQFEVGVLQGNFGPDDSVAALMMELQ